MSEKTENPPIKVRVFIEDHTGNRTREARIAANVPISDLLPALTSALQLPVTDPGGRPVAYHLAFGDGNIDANTTLHDAGVSDGAQLTIVPEMTAGGGPDLFAEKNGFLANALRALGDRSVHDSVAFKYAPDRHGSLARQFARLLGDSAQASAGGVLERMLERILALEKRIQDLEHRDEVRDMYSRRSGVNTTGSQKPERSSTSLTITFDSHNRRLFRATGAIDAQPFDGLIARWDSNSWSQWACYMGERWAALVVNNEAEESQLFWAEIWQRGQMLHDDVFGSDATLQRHYIAARAAVALGHEDDFLLRFVGPRWHLGIPFELLHERGTGTLATRYGLCRSVLGARNRKSHSLALRHELKVLVIASPSRSGAMLEAREIARVCASGANVKEVKLISTREVTWDEVVKHLSRCRYDIVHIAAAGRFDAAAPDESALLLPTNVAATEMKPLTASQIGQLLEGSVTDLFFASADYSAATGGREFLAHCDYLGVMDALVFAGIPCIVGYRWAVTDDGAREAAIRFYERLLIEGSPARALRHARHEGYVERGHDATHLGLVLVATEDTDDPISDMEGRRRGG